MKFFGFILSLVMIGTSCGQVQEKEVELELLPEGETNASYASSTTQSDEETEEEETEEEEDTTTLVGLPAALAEMDTRLSESCTTQSSLDNQCTFATAHEVTGIVTGARACSTVTSGTACSGVTGGPLWIMVQDADGIGAYLRVAGNKGGISDTVTVGSKVSFKVSKFAKFSGMLQITAVTDFVATTPTLTETFKLSSQVIDLSSLKPSDYSSTKSEGLWRLMTGVVQVTDATGTGTVTFPVVNKAGATFKVRMVKTTENVAANNCYLLENVMFTRFNSDLYQIDMSTSSNGGGFDYRTWGFGTLTKVTCADHGL